MATNVYSCKLQIRPNAGREGAPIYSLYLNSCPVSFTVFTAKDVPLTVDCEQGIWYWTAWLQETI